MSVLMKDIKKFNDQLKEIDPNMEVDVQFWVFHGKPAARKTERNGDHFIELAIYYNYKKDIPDLLQRIGRKLLCGIVTVNAFGRKRSRMLPDPVQDKLLAGRFFHIRPRKAQVIDGIFHSHVAGQVPAVLIHFVMHIHVPEDTVQHDVQVIPDRRLLLLPVAVKHMLRAV